MSAVAPQPFTPDGNLAALPDGKRRKSGKTRGDRDQDEKRTVEAWQKQFGQIGFIEDMDMDGQTTPGEIFERADKRLNALVSLGVIAGLLAGTSLGTIGTTLASEELAAWVECCSLVSCAASIGVSILVAYHYYNGAKLLSLGHLTVDLFNTSTAFIKQLCVKGFVVASLAQMAALILIAVDRVANRMKTAHVVTLVAVLLSTAITLGAMHLDKGVYRRCKHMAERPQQRGHQREKEKEKEKKEEVQKLPQQQKE